MDSAETVPEFACPVAELSLQAFLAESAQRIRHARLNINRYICRTPVLTSRVLDELTGTKLFFKCENFQAGGAFKARGAHHAILSLPDHLVANGVITHSSGNHGVAVTLAARNRGLKAHVVMPHDSSATKIESIRRYGGTISLCEPTLAAREATTRDLTRTSGAVFVHPYDDYDVIAGQATVGCELLEQAPEVEMVLTPVGGGGLLSGVAIAGRTARPSLEVYGVEPERVDDATRSFHTGVLQPPTNRPTIADGLRVALGKRNFAIIGSLVDDIVTVTEDEIIEALRLIWEVLKIVVEPSSAVPLAAIMQRKVKTEGRRVGVILTGGNIDLDNLPWVGAWSARQV